MADGARNYFLGRHSVSADFRYTDSRIDRESNSARVKNRRRRRYRHLSDFYRLEECRIHRLRSGNVREVGNLGETGIADNSRSGRRGVSDGPEECICIPGFNRSRHGNRLGARVGSKTCATLYAAGFQERLFQA